VSVLRWIPPVVTRAILHLFSGFDNKVTGESWKIVKSKSGCLRLIRLLVISKLLNMVMDFLDWSYITIRRHSIAGLIKTKSGRNLCTDM
jgi:hypothetical protein